MADIQNEHENNEGNELIARPEGQFMKSITMETPDAPEIFSIMRKPPEVDVKFNLDTDIINEEQGLYIVILDIKTEANINDEDSNDKKTAFRCNLKYCGLFTIKNLNQEQRERALLIEAPTLLFPFARRIIATATTDAGFPPLMLAPVNFAQKYMTEKKEDNK
jgi:preprotein translocase subunit SecB